MITVAYYVTDRAKVKTPKKDARQSERQKKEGKGERITITGACRQPPG
jgi:hypothetical protein